MKKSLIGILLFVLGAGAGAFGWRWYGAVHLAKAESAEAGAKESGKEAGKEAAADEDEDEEDKPEGPVTTVTTVPVIEETLQPSIEALGSVIVAPNAVSSVAWPSELNINKVLVIAGQSVERDAPIAEVRPSRDAELQLSLAKQTHEAADRSLELAKQRVDRGLASKTEVVTAEASANDARERFERLKASVPPADGLIRAASAGVVQIVRVQPGTVALANSAIVDIAAPGNVLVQLGVEPTEASRLIAGQSVSLVPIEGQNGEKYSARVMLVSPTINPTTRLVDVSAAFVEASPRVGTVLRGSVALPEMRTLTVPRGAIVPDGDEITVFVMRSGKACRTVVGVGAASGDRVPVTSGVSAGDRVIVTGISTIHDGALVREEGAVESR
ncbi:MAG: efflux RND transporter periplasmic adaptor subunit [Phycisphaerales bacterium]